MTVEQLRRVCQAKPFQPFTMRLADGSEVHVPHMDFILPHPTSGRTVAVAMPDDTFVIVDLLLVSALEVGNGRTRRRARSQ